MRTLNAFLFVTLIYCAVAVSANAELWAERRSRIFASETGTYGFKVLLNEQGILFILKPDGSERVLWRSKLSNLPWKVMVADTDQIVVTVDQYGEPSASQAIVVYGRGGVIVCQLGLQQILKPSEIRRYHGTVVGDETLYWHSRARFEFDGTDDNLVVTLRWGRHFKVNLRTGKVL